MVWRITSLLVASPDAGMERPILTADVNICQIVKRQVPSESVTFGNKRGEFRVPINQQILEFIYWKLICYDTSEA